MVESSPSCEALLRTVQAASLASFQAFLYGFFVLFHSHFLTSWWSSCQLTVTKKKSEQTEVLFTDLEGSSPAMVMCSNQPPEQHELGQTPAIYLFDL